MSVMDILECKNCKMIGWLKMDERVFETGLLVLEQTTRTPLTTRSDPSIRLVSPHKNFLRLCLSTARLLTLLTYRSTMTIDKHNPTQQRQQPQSLTQALSSLPTADLGLPVRSIPNARQDPREHREFLRSILHRARTQCIKSKYIAINVLQFGIAAAFKYCKFIAKFRVLQLSIGDGAVLQLSIGDCWQYRNFQKSGNPES
jgi:hypothetical protein